MPANDHGCESYSGRATSFDEARDRLLDTVSPVKETQTVALSAAVDRVVACDLVANSAVPPCDSSAMDGYAICCSDLAKSHHLPISQRVPAGVFPTPLQPGTAARIFTGAPVPERADVVVMQEFCTEFDGSVIVNVQPELLQNIRPKGETLREGSVIIECGTRLRPQEIGIAACMGADRLSVYRRLKVALLSTGDELVEPGKTLGPGQIYNSNRYQLSAMCTALGCEVVDLGIVPDRLDATKRALKSASEAADVIVTSGGVSVGEEDHLRNAIAALGKIDLWRVRMKPGKPLAFGRIGKAPIIGLPGNPVAAFVSFCLFAKPYLQKASGVSDVSPRPLRYPAGFSITVPGNRREFLRVRIDQQGRLQLFANQGSGVLTSVRWADGVAVLHEGTTVCQNQSMDFIRFD